MYKRVVVLVFLFAIFCPLADYHFAEAGQRIIKNIEVQGSPISLAVDEAGGRLFILNKAHGTLVIIDEKELSLIKEINLNKRVSRNLDSHSLAYNPALNRLYISTGDEGIVAIDGRAYEKLFEIRDKINKKFIPELAFDGSHLYLLDWSGYIYKYDKDGNFETTIEIKNQITGIGDTFMLLGPLGRLYLSSVNKGLIVVDKKTGKVTATVPIENLSSTPESSWNTVYVAGSGKLHIVDAKGLTVKKTIDIEYPNFSGLGMAINTKADRLFLITSGDTVTVIDTKKMKKMDKLKVCAGPRSIAINKTTNTVYVACPNSNAITVIKDK